MLKLISTKAKELADNAQKSADEANGAIDDIVSDGKLDPSEKITIKRDFLAFYHELMDDNGLKDKGRDENHNFYAGDIETAYDKIVDCFNEVGTLLNGSSSWALGAVMDEGHLPVWLQNPPTVLTSTDKNEYITVTSTINADDFRSKWSAMYAAKSAYIALLSEYAKGLADNAQKSADEKVQTFVTKTVPDPPYKKGDMWIQTGNGNNVMISLVDRESGDTTSSLERLEDWTDLSELSTKQDPRIQLAMLGDKIYELSGGYIQNHGKIAVAFSSNQPASATDGDLWFDGTNLRRYVSSSWSIIDSDSYAGAFKTVFDIVGQQTLTCFSSVQTQNMKLYDLVLRNIKWHDPFKDETVDGNVEVLMYNGKSWETLKECTRAIIDNLGDELRLVVFGSDGKGATDASGLITRTMFSELFSEKVTLDSDGNVSNVSKSGLVATTDFDTWKNGELKGLLDDKLDVSAFAGMYAKAVEADGTIVKTASMSVYVTKDGNNYISNAKIKADNIELEGLVTANSYFKVLEDGSIEAANATISGTINATSGKIGNFKINGGYLGLTDGLSNTNNDGMWLTDDEIGFNNNGRQVVVGPFSSLGYDYLGWFKDNDSNSLMSKTGVVIDVSGSMDKNIALKLQGGCISGLAIHTQSLGLEEITNSSFQQMYNGVKTNLDNIPVYNTLTKYMNAVLVNTQFSYRAKATDDYTTYSRDRYITLPEMTDADDGHVLMIKRGKGGNSVYVCPGKYKKLVSSSSGFSVTYSTETNDTFMLVNDQQYIADANLKLGSESDAMTFVFFKSLQYTVYDKKYSGGSKTFKGCWVQWKNPRDW